MVTVMLVLSITNKQNGLRENKAVVNSEARVRQFALNYKDELINLDAFKINSITAAENFSLEEQFYIESMEEIITDTQRSK